MKFKLLASLLMSASVFYQASAVAEDEIEEFPEHLLYFQTQGQKDNNFVRYQHIDQKRVWESGQTLRVCFFGANKVVAELVSTIGAEWSMFANVTFDFGPKSKRRDCTHPAVGFSHIRVGFASPGYWSLIGTDSTQLAGQYQPSLNLSRFNTRYSTFNGYSVDSVLAKATESDKGTIRHEFGHALGLLHEHQQSDVNCWDKIIKTGENNIYDYFFEKYGWNKDKVERNIGLAITYDPGSVSGIPDLRDSVMSYKLPVEVLVKGKDSDCYIEARSNKISKLDALWVAKYYPSNPVATVITEDSLLANNFPIGISPSSNQNLSNDYIKRIEVDLESENSFVRREARTRLSQYINTANAETIDQLALKLSKGSYRSQLGFSAALAKSTSKYDVPAFTRDSLQEILSTTTDEILRSNVESALSR